MIGVDWGTSSFRAFRLAPDGTILARRQAARGILAVEGGAFAAVLDEMVGDWLRDGEDRLLLSGMIGSRNGWREVPYLPCPAGIEAVAAAAMPVAFDGGRVLIVPGLVARDAEGTAEVMRGEETQILGLLASIGPGGGMICLPGTHSKWADIEGGGITGFTTHMTGEMFAALCGHTILGRLMAGAAEDADSFDRGVARSDDGGGLLHHLFGVRTLVLVGELVETGARSYLSGLLIGHEIRAAIQGRGADAPEGPVHLVGEAALCRLYARALRACGRDARIETPEAASIGLARIGELASWT